jgi:hypothetical protein
MMGLLSSMKAALHTFLQSNWSDSFDVEDVEDAEDLTGSMDFREVRAFRREGHMNDCVNFGRLATRRRDSIVDIIDDCFFIALLSYFSGIKLGGEWDKDRRTS